MQLAASIQQKAEPAPSRNPKPAGSIEPGSATDEVYRFLLEHQDGGRWWSRRQLGQLLVRGNGAMDWALRQLVAAGKVESSVSGRSTSICVMYRLRVK